MKICLQNPHMLRNTVPSYFIVENEPKDSNIRARNIVTVAAAAAASWEIFHFVAAAAAALLLQQLL